MKQYECCVEIAAPIERVFALCTDFEHLPQFIPTIIRVEMVTPGPTAVGTQFRETRRMFHREATEVMTVTSLTPDREVSLTATSCGVRYDSQFLFEPIDSGTEVTLKMGITAHTAYAKIMGRLMSFLMKGMMVKMLRQDLECVRKRAEAQS